MTGPSGGLVYSRDLETVPQRAWRMPTAASRAGARTSMIAIPATICSRRSTTTPTRFLRDRHRVAVAPAADDRRAPGLRVGLRGAALRRLRGVPSPIRFMPTSSPFFFPVIVDCRRNHLQQDRVRRGGSRGGHRSQPALQVTLSANGPISSPTWPMTSTRPTRATSATARSTSTSTRSMASRKPRTRSPRSARSRRTSPRREAWGPGGRSPATTLSSRRLVPGIQPSACAKNYGDADPVSRTA